MNKATAKVYNFRLGYFDSFVSNDYNITLDDMVEQIKKASQDPYDILNDYICYLQQNSRVSPLALKQWVVTVKNFLEYNDVDISPRKFKLKVKLPKAIRKNKEALGKEDVVNILNSCSNIRLKTYVMLLASTGAQLRPYLSGSEILILNLMIQQSCLFVENSQRPRQIDLYFLLRKWQSN